MTEAAAIVLLIGRIVFSIRFLAAGFAHFEMSEQMVGYARSMGSPVCRCSWVCGPTLER